MAKYQVFDRRIMVEHLQRLADKRLRKKIEAVENPYPQTFWLDMVEYSHEGYISFEECRQAILKALEV